MSEIKEKTFDQIKLTEEDIDRQIVVGNFRDNTVKVGFLVDWTEDFITFKTGHRKHIANRQNVRFK